MSLIRNGSRYVRRRIAGRSPLHVTEATEGQMAQAAVFAPIPHAIRGASRELRSCRDKEVLIEGPFGTGKTWGNLAYAYELMDAYPGIRILLLRKTIEELRESGVVTWEKVVPPEHPMLLGSRKSKRIYTHTNGSELVLGGLHNAEAIKKVKSSEYDIIYVLEATEITEEDYEILIGRLRNNILPWQQIWLDVNPGPPQHWINQRAIRGELTRFRSRHEDNPYYHDGEDWTPAGRDYVLGTLQRMRGVCYKRNVLGLWVANEGTVYDTYDPDTHNSAQYPEHCPYAWRRIWTTDFGYSNAFVWQQWAIDPDGRMWLEFEIYHTRKLMREHADMIREATKLTPKPEAWLCDHDAQDRMEMEALLGIATMPAYKSIRVGIDNILDRLNVQPDGRPRIYFRENARVHPPDPYLLEKGLPLCTADEFGYYSYPQGANKRDEPVDEHNHGMDAMRYGGAFVDRLGVERASGVTGLLIKRARRTISG